MKFRSRLFAAVLLVSAIVTAVAAGNAIDAAANSITELDQIALRVIPGGGHV